MASSKKTWVAFKGNLIIPADMAGEDKDLQVQDGEPVQVPAFYADSVVQDGIAERCDAPKKKRAAKKTEDPTAEQIVASEKAKQLEDAQTAATDALTALKTAEGTDAAEGARAALQVAQEALDELQS